MEFQLLLRAYCQGTNTCCAFDSLYCFVLFCFRLRLRWVLVAKKMRRPDIPHIFGFYLISCGSVKKKSKKNQSDLFAIQILNSRSGYQQWRKKYGFISTQDFSFLLFYSKIRWITNQIHFHGTVKQKKTDFVIILYKISPKWLFIYNTLGLFFRH